MKMKIFFAVSAVAATAVVCSLTGCVETVTKKQALGVPYARDYVEGEYERTVDQVFNAAKTVVEHAGTLLNESTLHDQTNLVKTLEGKVNQKNVYVRVEAVTPKVSHIAVQARHPAGAPDMNLAHQLEKDVALALVGTR